jgi:hypothetical protein
VLTPDTQQTQQQMQHQVAAAAAVTDYCQAVLTLLPAYSSLVTGGDLATVVQDATAHAGEWTSGLCAACAHTVPESIVDFADAYERAEARLLADERALLSDPADDRAKADLTQRLSSLAAALQQRGALIASLRQRLTAFQSTLQGDYTASSAVIARLSQTSESGVIVSEAQAQLGLNFVQSQQLAPCVAIVTLDAQVAVNLDGGSAAGTEVIPAVLIDALLSSLQSRNADTTQALSALADTWQVVTAKYASVATDLQQAQADQVGGILQQLDLQQAATAWRQLAQFARSLVPASSTVPDPIVAEQTC